MRQQGSGSVAGTGRRTRGAARGTGSSQVKIPVPAGTGAGATRVPRLAGQTGGMASVLAVDDPADKRLADYTRLTDGRLRRSLESQHGLFIAEGERVIRRAIEAGYRLRSLLVSTERLEALGDLATSCAAPVYVVPADVAEQLTGYHVHRGALASVRRRPGPGGRRRTGRRPAGGRA
jgi:hypothetical protein